MLTGLGTPDEMKKYVADGTVKEFELWDPADLGYLAAYAAVELRVRRHHQQDWAKLRRRLARKIHGWGGPHHPAW